MAHTYLRHIGLTLASLLAAGQAEAGTLTVVHALSGGTGAAQPYGGLAIDAGGNLYGETFYGGMTDDGSIFKITPAGQEIILHSFDAKDGLRPQTAPSLDGPYVLAPTLYSSHLEAGTVYGVTTDGSQGEVVHKFMNGADGASPEGRLTVDAKGNLFGTTCGSFCGDQSGGNGTVYEITKFGAYTVLHQFSTADGINPQSYLALAADGTMFGTTIAAGPTGARYSGGTLFSLAKDGTFRVLYAFPATSFPASGVLLAKDGSLIGTSRDGGAYGDGYLYRYRNGVLTDCTISARPVMRPRRVPGSLPTSTAIWLARRITAAPSGTAPSTNGRRPVASRCCTRSPAAPTATTQANGAAVW